MRMRSCGLGGAMAAALPSGAQNYPDRPITLIVPYAAGGSSDVLGRLLGERLSARLGQTIVIDNRAGAGSRVGIEYAARAAPDGYTLLLADMPHTIIPAIQKDVRYHPVRDFTPVGADRHRLDGAIRQSESRSEQRRRVGRAWRKPIPAPSRSRPAASAAPRI